MNNKDEKLTLKLNSQAIKKAKVLAKKRGLSLSRMVETFFETVSEPDLEVKEYAATPLVSQLEGVLSLEENYSREDDYADYLNKKYRP